MLIQLLMISILFSLEAIQKMPMLPTLCSVEKLDWIEFCRLDSLPRST